MLDDKVDINIDINIDIDINIKTSLDYYDYNLPENLIAYSPTKNRTDSRLMCINRENKSISHNKFKDIITFLKPNDLLVLNESKVIQARLYGVKPTGGKIELLVERIESDCVFLAQVKSSKSLKSGQIIEITENNFKNNDTNNNILKNDNLEKFNLEKINLKKVNNDNLEKSNPEKINLKKVNIEVIERSGIFYRLKLNKNNCYKNIIDVLDKLGHIPLPPYIKREDQDIDKTRYQTVYAKNLGSAAAPTAGLHFDKDLLNLIKQKGVEIAKVTLHVGSGTFTPVRSDNIKNHKMHSEYIECPQEVCDKINKAKKTGGRVIAVGTTSMRVLESVAGFSNQNNLELKLDFYKGETDIFIYPGYKFKIVDALITNFHLPKSSLLMLVYAFGGDELIKKSYKESILEQYRFFSYGDAMFIE